MYLMLENSSSKYIIDIQLLYFYAKICLNKKVKYAKLPCVLDFFIIISDSAKLKNVKKFETMKKSFFKIRVGQN